MKAEPRFGSLVLLNNAAAAHCFITQTALAMALSYIFSNSVYVFSFFTGLYLMSMGLGVLVVERLRIREGGWPGIIFVNVCLGLLLACPGIPGLLLLNELSYHWLRSGGPDLLGALFPAGIAFTMLIGMVSGAELPIFSRLIESGDEHPSRPLIAVLTSDYLGAAAGVAAFAFVLYPFFGLIRAVIVSQVLTLACLDAVYFSGGGPVRTSRRTAGLTALNIFAACAFFGKERFVLFLDSVSGW